MMATTQNFAGEISLMNPWPPSENIRSIMVEHIINCLSSESCFSNKEEAAEDAKRIEGAAFVAANHHASRCPNADGSSTTRFYAKETGKQLLDALKRGGPAETKGPNGNEGSPKIIEVKESVFDILKVEGERGFVDEALATEIFRLLEEPGNSCTKICFGSRSFGVEAAYVAKRVLMGVQKTLTDVDLVDFVFKRPEAEALQVMSIFSSALEGCMLRSLGFNVGEWGEKGVKAFGSLLKSQKTLEELKILNSNISVKAARAICEHLPSVERIKSLHFPSNQLGDGAAEVFAELVKKCIALEYFDFSANFIGIEGAIALVQALRNGSRLKMLDLTSNTFGKRGGIALRQVISGHLGLTEVYLSYMNLEDEGVIAIADSLKEAAPSLRVLTIGGNNITSKAAPALAECLAVKNLLTIFYADENKLKDDGTILICKAISKGHEQLQELDLSTNAITGIGAKAAAEAVANKPDFSRLFISGNFITKKGIDTVKDVLRKGTKGESVLGVLYQYKDVGHMPYEYKEEGLSDSDTELEEKLQKPKLRYGMQIFSIWTYIRTIVDTLNPMKVLNSVRNHS